jgi:hypothetical protein
MWIVLQNHLDVWMSFFISLWCDLTWHNMTWHDMTINTVSILIDVAASRIMTSIEILFPFPFSFPHHGISISCCHSRFKFS